MTSESASSSATAATTTSESTPKSPTAARGLMKASKTQAISSTASVASTEKLPMNLLGRPTCPECGAKMEHAGPLWTGSILDPVFVDAMIKENQNTAFKNSAKITKLLTITKTEATAPAAYYVLDKLSGKLNLPAPSVQTFLTALRNSGFSAGANPLQHERHQNRRSSTGYA